MADQDSRAGKRYDSKEIIDYVNRVHASHDGALAQAFAVPDGIPAIHCEACGVVPVPSEMLWVRFG